MLHHMRLRLLFATAAILVAAIAAPAGAAPNIVLISIDTLRADHLPMYGYSVNTAPFVSKLAEDGVVFERAIVPLPNTTPSHASMLTGVYPGRHGAVGLAIPMRRGIDTLAAALARQGYFTAASVAVGHVGRRFNFDQGFAEFAQPADNVARRNGDAVNADAIASLQRYRARKSRQGLFLFVHYFDCHAPYGTWRGDLRDSAQLPERERIAQYDDAIRRVDALIRELHDAFRRSGMLEDTIFCITADHGEQLGERGLASGHADIYSETTHVPMIISGPGVPATRVSQLVSPMDLAPTLARLGGARLRHATDGIDVLPKSGMLDSLAYSIRGVTAANGRSLVVIGNPWYARSVGLQTQNRYYIRNFDKLYREVRSQALEPATSDVAMKPLTAAKAADGLRFPLPVTSYSPFTVTVDVRNMSRECTGEIGAQMDPGFTYFRIGADRASPVRLQFSGGRLDYITLSLKGSGCTATARYRLERRENAKAIGGTVATTYLHNIIYSPRKAREGDEVYDMDADPAMEQNIIASVPRQEVEADDRLLRAEYVRIYGRSTATGETTRVPKEEIEKLKSLGYLF